MTDFDKELAWKDQAMLAQSINSSMDCRFAGRWAEMSGSHCPAERPCARCTAEREIEKLQSDVERLTKERDEAVSQAIWRRMKPAAEDAELDTAVALLARLVKELRRG